MILHARLAVLVHPRRAGESIAFRKTNGENNGESIAFRNQYIGCSRFAGCSRDSRPGFTADAMGTTTLDEPGSMTCDSCSGTVDASETKPCCTAQRLESGVPVDDWKPSASLPPARPEPSFWV
jgi:hypothetical protein